MPVGQLQRATGQRPVAAVAPGGQLAGQALGDLLVTQAGLGLGLECHGQRHAGQGGQTADRQQQTRQAAHALLSARAPAA